MPVVTTDVCSGVRNWKLTTSDWDSRDIRVSLAQGDRSGKKNKDCYLISSWLFAQIAHWMELIMCYFSCLHDNIEKSARNRMNIVHFSISSG
jgi:hypothetical protein